MEKVYHDKRVSGNGNIPVDCRDLAIHTVMSWPDGKTDRIGRPGNTLGIDEYVLGV